MSLSATELSDVVDACSAALLGARVIGVRASADEPLALVLELDPHPVGPPATLLVAATPGATRLGRVSRRPPAPETPPAIVMLLRKRAMGARLEALSCPAGDRVVSFELRRGDLVTVVVAELLGRCGAIIALDEDRRVLAALRSDGLGDRARPGDLYTPPPPVPTGASHGTALVATAGDSRRAGWPVETPPDAFVEATYAEALSSAALATRLRAALHRIDTALARARRRIAAIERDLAKIDQADALRVEAELLQGAYGRVPRGAESVEVDDWYADPPARRTIALDPRADLQGNIDARFRRYRRMRRGEATALERMLAAESERDALAAVRTTAPSPDDAAGIVAFEAELDRLRLRAPAQPPPGARDGNPQARAYHVFVASDGAEIWVGKNARDNDTLTFRVARGRDIWLHAADWPGSHVVIPVRAGPPSHQTLLEAAQLAAHYSRGRADTVVGVHVTERKHVRKPKGAPAGRVSLAGARTLEIGPDPAVIAALHARTPQDAGD
ncbi:MAG: DUF814 domain-containing protein [Myxococcales bacterium]|nr:DUF814 domain-containing protein [Myxococcales bacterium]MCB9532337.1 DUF814 domain-containing protein [Myxococcales bacterium]MCB9534589.1 DUF814 domain-containing protein [Myxococcales bacterium]